MESSMKLSATPELIFTRDSCAHVSGGSPQICRTLLQSDCRLHRPHQPHQPPAASKSEADPADGRSHGVKRRVIADLRCISLP